MTSSPSVNLLDLDAQGLVAYCDSLGEKPFRAKQLQRWIHQYNAADFDGMTDLAKSLREKLKGRAIIGMPDIVSDRLAMEQIFSNLIDNAVKYLKPGQPGDIEVRGRTKLGTGGMRGQLPLLLHRQARFFTQSHHRRDHRPAAHGGVRPACFAFGRGWRPCDRR